MEWKRIEYNETERNGVEWNEREEKEKRKRDLQGTVTKIRRCCLPDGGLAVTGRFVGLAVTGRFVGILPQYIKFACCISLELSPRVFPSFVLPSLRVIVVRPLPKAVEW